jgi:SAM-dependent methyltransferase
MYKVEGMSNYVKWDLSKTPLPFKDNEFDLIIANHILEHVPNWWECFKELARIVKVGGIIEVWLPGDGSYGQQGYRDHINVINFCSFAGIRGTFRNSANSWEIQDRENNGEVSNLAYASEIMIKPMNYWWIHIMSAKTQLWMMTHLRNVVQEQGYKFVKLKGDDDGTI